MNILLDTHFVLWIGEDALHRAPPKARAIIADRSARLYASAVNFWEIAIKARKAGIKPLHPVTHLPDILSTVGVTHLPITYLHGVADLAEEPATKDPFDRMLLAQAQVEGMKLLTVDKILRRHPLAAAL